MTRERGGPSGDPRPEDGVMEVTAEEIAVTKREVATGRVRVSTETDEVEEVVRQELEGTRAEVARAAVGRTLEPGETPPGTRSEGEVTIIRSSRRSPWSRRASS